MAPTADPSTADFKDSQRDPVCSRLGRYRAILPDWEAFLAAQEGTDLPVVLSVNRERITTEALMALLREEGFAPQPLSWTKAAIALPPGSRPALHWTYAAGLFHIQEEASQLPLALLDAQPGERVLDLCAAPGGKSAQLCLDVGPQGTVVANDKDGKRLAAVRERMKRLGLANLVTTVHDGASLPRDIGLFDRVLVDAPCSAEGNPSQTGANRAKAGSASGGPRSEDFIAWLTGTQRALLRRAVEVLKPGGRLVYSTCSLAPEENEAVVEALLTERPDLRIVPVPLPGLAWDPGLTEWQGQRFRPALAQALRLWPQRARSGAFFAVALEKAGGSDAAAIVTTTPAQPEPAPDGEAVLEVLRARFGLSPEAFAGLSLTIKGPQIQAYRSTMALPARPRLVSLGLPLVRLGGAFPKPTTAAALAFGTAATRNVLEVSAEEADCYLAREPFHPDPTHLIAAEERGYVMVRRKGWPLGVALLRHEDGRAVIDSQYPRVWSAIHAARRGFTSGA